MTGLNRNKGAQVDQVEEILLNKIVSKINAKESNELEELIFLSMTQNFYS